MARSPPRYRPLTASFTRAERAHSSTRSLFHIAVASTGTPHSSLAPNPSLLTHPSPSPHTPQLGMLSLVVDDMQLFDNDLTSALPTELGNLDLIETGFELYSLSLNGTVPTELGRFTEMSRSFE